MSRHVLPHSQLTLTRDPEPSASPVAVEQPVVAGAEPPARKDWYFVKNINPKEKIMFADGESLVFPSQVFHTQDPVLAAKIIAASATYRIVLQS